MTEWLQAAIEFESLGLSPELFSIGPFALRWYSLSYIAGILLAWWYVGRLIDAGPVNGVGAPLTRDHADALVTWATLGVILGGRLVYVIFYDWPKFADDPMAILRLWEGGMAFHGGTLGVIVAVVLFCRINKLDWLRVHDYVACAVPIGLFLGRCANFVNGELWGRPTGGDWGIVFPGAGDTLPRHPSQLYEAALEGAVLFALLWWLFWRTDARARPGRLAGVFLLGYGVFRFAIEYFRQPDAQLGVLSTGLTMGQTLCVPMILVGAWLIATSEARWAKQRAVSAG